MASLISFLLSTLIKPKTCIRRNKHNIPLPSICHREIPASEIGSRSVFVIGDVHGCYEEMCELIDKAREIENELMFIFVGDLVNKGPRSDDVVRKIREMGTNAYAVRGNHDESALREVRNLKNDPEHYALRQDYSWIRNLNNDDINYLSELPYTISLPSLNSIVVHAGLVPGKPLKLQNLNDMTNMRNVINEGDPFESNGLIGYRHTDKGVAWIDTWSGPEHVFFGHDARRLLQESDHATGLDTGCVYGGHLSGIFINKPDGLLTIKSRQKSNFD